jgi:hypothetical protein
VLKASPIKKKERPVRNSIDLKRDRESAVRTAGDNEFQQSMDHLKKEEKNFVEPLVGPSKIGKDVLEESSGIKRLK